MEDLIKRESAIEAIEDTDWYHINRNGDLVSGARSDGTALYKAGDVYKALKEVPSADRPSESIGKLIERMEEYRDKQLLMSDYWYGINWAINTIRVSDVADRPQGEWIEQEDDYHHYWECSECGMGVGLDDIRNYCPHCGCRMKGADDGNK